MTDGCTKTFLKFRAVRIFSCCKGVLKIKERDVTGSKNVHQLPTSVKSGSDEKHASCFSKRSFLHISEQSSLATNDVVNNFPIFSRPILSALTIPRFTGS